MSQEPHGQSYRALTALRVGSRGIHINIDVENVKVFPRGAREGLGGANDDAAIAADQQGNMPRLLQKRRYSLAHIVRASS